MINKLLCLLLLITFSSAVFAKKKNKQKIIYKYKKYEKFDFEELMIEGETGAEPFFN